MKPYMLGRGVGVGSDGFRGVVGLKSDKERGVSWAGLQPDNDRESLLIRDNIEFPYIHPVPCPRSVGNIYIGACRNRACGTIHCKIMTL